MTKKIILVVFASMLSPSLGLAVIIAFIFGNIFEKHRYKEKLKREQTARFYAEQNKQAAEAEKLRLKREREAERERAKIERLEEQTAKKDAARFQAKETIKHYTAVLEELRKQLDRLDTDIKFAELARDIDKFESCVIL